MLDKSPNINEKVHFKSVKKIFNRELKRLESTDVEFISIDKLDQYLEKTIRRNEGINEGKQYDVNLY